MTAPSTVTSSEAARKAAEAAGRAVIAVATAAENAAVKGGKTSESKITIGAILFAGAAGALKALALIPGPWQLVAALGLGAMGSAAVYANSRGKVKAAAQAAAATTGSGPVTLPLS
jgi:hypothetical protein